MAEQDDIFSLPPPPPPAPARHEAAIGEAIRRFDNGGAAPPAKPLRSPGSRWSIASRPQLGILAAASLVAVIGLPLAWQTVTQKTEPAAEMASQDTSKSNRFDMGASPPAVVFEPTTTAAPPVVSAKNEQPSQDQSPAAKPEVPTQLAEAKASRESEAGGGRQDMARTQGNIMAAPAAIAPAMPAAAPPPPPAMAKAEAPAPAESRGQLADVSDIIVTTAKRRGGGVPDRGDWNACTIDDPKRSLAACKSLVNPGAKGARGQAAAQLADGLSLAWQGNIDRAITAFDQAIAIDPKSSLAYLNRGLALRRLGEEDRALADLDRAVKLAPTARSYYHRSLLQREKGNERRARADESRAVELDSDYEAVIGR